MENGQFWTLVSMLGGLIAMVVGGFAWLIYRVESKTEKLGEKIDAIGNRVSKLEGESEVIKTLLQTIMSFLLGHRTGTEK